MTSAALKRLMRDNEAARDVLHTERCYYPRPLETLTALFGAENCDFSRCEGIDMLRIRPSQLVYSRPSAHSGDWRAALAQEALAVMPPRHIAAEMRRRVLDNDPTRAIEPFAMRCGSTKRARTGADRQEMIDDLQRRLHCRSLVLRTTPVRVNGQLYYRCHINGGNRNFEPHVYCATSETAELQALVNALCKV